MKTFNALKLSHRFATLIAVFLLGFVVYGAGSFKALSDLKVSGPLYQQIVQGKDLVADILPPPEYVIESYLVALQLSVESDKAEQVKLIEKMKSLKIEYDTRHEFWAKEGLGDELNDVFLKQAHAPAVEFYSSVLNSLIPAVQKGDKDTINAAMVRIKQAYTTHRTAIDQVVTIANKRVAADEETAKRSIQSTTLLLLVILGISIMASIVVATAISRSVLANLGGEPAYAMKIAHAIADRDLTLRVETKAGDQTSLLAAMRTMQQNLAATINGVNLSVEQLAQAATQLSDSANRVSGTTDQQSDTTQSMAASMEELSVSINQLTDNAKETERSTLSSGEISSQGLRLVIDANQEISKAAEAVSYSAQHLQKLGEQSGKISATVNTIKEIADQTNLLALNAAIEAARAGEQGRGFAVVADEVRKLAERTSSATQEISGMLSSIEQGIQGAINTMGDATTRVNGGAQIIVSVRESIEKIMGSSDHVVAEVRDMTSALHEQSNAHNQVASSVSVIAEKIEQTSREVHAIAQSASTLNALSTSLKATVNQFKTS